ncbi:MAG: hypothetical protein OHK0028_11140 [Deltaproteobacteria bacterium]
MHDSQSIAALNITSPISSRKMPYARIDAAETAVTMKAIKRPCTPDTLPHRSKRR